jgi:hypothetical protein
MPYTTPELVLGKSKLGSELELAEVEPFIKDAQARIDIKLRRRYKVPFVDPVPSIIESVATNFAAAFAIERDYSNRPEKHQPYLAEVLIKRAEADLQDILDDALLDGLAGVEFAPAAPVEPSALARPALQSTKTRLTDMEKALERW